MTREHGSDTRKPEFVVPLNIPNIRPVLDYNIGKLNTLKKLVVKRNNLSIIPQSFNSLNNLMHLNISNNNLSAFPLFIRDLKQLKEIEIHWNPFVIDPSVISDLSQLESLTLDILQLKKSLIKCWNLPNLKKISIRIHNKDNRKKYILLEQDLIKQSKNSLSMPEIDEIQVQNIQNPVQTYEFLMKLLT